MSLLIRSKNDLHLLEKDKIKKKLNELSKTISESFAKKIYGEDPKKPIQFSRNVDNTARVKVEFAKVKDHLLSKIHEAKDTSFYNILALYFEQYFKLIKYGEKKSNHMTDAQFNKFLEDINELNTELGTVYERVYPENYQGFILTKVDRSNLNKSPFSLTGTLMRDRRDNNCKFTGQLQEIHKNITFTDIDKHSQIKYIGGKEYYMSRGEYGTIYLQGNDDSKGEEHGKKLRESSAKLSREQSSQSSDMNNDDFQSVNGDDDFQSVNGDDYFQSVNGNDYDYYPTPQRRTASDFLGSGLANSASSTATRPYPALSTVQTRIPNVGHPTGTPDTNKNNNTVKHRELGGRPKGRDQAPVGAYPDTAEQQINERNTLTNNQQDVAQSPDPSALPYPNKLQRNTVRKTREEFEGGRRKKHIKSKKYYKKTRAKKRKKTKKR